MTPTILLRVAAVLCGVVVLSACHVESPDDPSATSAAAGQSVTISEVHEGIWFYPACGNEVVTVEGTTWYQLYAEEEAEVDESRYPDPTPGGDSPVGSRAPDADAAGRTPVVTSAGGGPRMPAAARSVILPQVPAPEEGDDTGTLTVYSDGMARFVSDNGRYTAWLSQEERAYNWVC